VERAGDGVGSEGAVQSEPRDVPPKVELYKLFELNRVDP
jgi:hypothetical protein